MQILRNLNVTTGGRRTLGVPDVGILAATIASETATGDQGPGLLYDESINPANAGKYLRVRITTLPSAGNLFVYENGAIDFNDAPDGVYIIGYDWDADDVFGGSDTATIVVGSVNAAATGATLSGASTLTPGSAQGTSAGTAPGATLSGASGLSAGSASGTASGTAPGANLAGSSSISPGIAPGGGVVDGSASGATLTGTSGLAAGSASGNVSSAAPGATLAGTSSLDAGAAAAVAYTRLPSGHGPKIRAATGTRPADLGSAYPITN